MFNRKKKKIEQLTATIELMRDTLLNLTGEIEERERELEYKESIINEQQLTNDQLNASLDVSRHKIKELESKLVANKSINNVLKKTNQNLSKKNKSLMSEIEHTRNVNRERQRRFREAHKDDK